VLALFLVGAAVATALALNDNGGGQHGRAAAAGGVQARRPAGGPANPGAKANAAKPHNAKPHAAKPHSATSPAAKTHGAKHAAKAHAPKARAAAPAKPSGSRPGQGKAPGPSSPPGSKTGQPRSSGGGSSSGSTPAGGSENAQRTGPCRAGPAASPAQSGYGSQAGVAQATLEPCNRGRTESAGLAHTGLDVALVLACAALLVALGASLRRLGADA
jgi:hypothetical protein